MIYGYEKTGKDKIVDRVRNDRVLRRIGEEREILKESRERNKTGLDTGWEENACLMDATEGIVTGDEEGRYDMRYGWWAILR